MHSFPSNPFLLNSLISTTDFTIQSILLNSLVSSTVLSIQSIYIQFLNIKNLFPFNPFLLNSLISSTALSIQSIYIQFINIKHSLFPLNSLLIVVSFNPSIFLYFLIQSIHIHPNTSSLTIHPPSNPLI